ncbi:hypothetical protein H2199_005460 [Coniosporium tulheliwenetii]|uniref:Uncharacterized protein n=1 Tax=Coniosporium tulheliwenetii TaxID=3383036 RepID=A0ACC2Z291_9PEZI|nr:hypothetical protein H2199_005460 [Cladosporium sp. JES 115]
MSATPALQKIGDDEFFEAVRDKPLSFKNNLIHLWYEDHEAAWALVELDLELDSHTSLSELRDMAAAARAIQQMSLAGPLSFNASSSLQVLSSAAAGMVPLEAYPVAYSESRVYACPEVQSKADQAAQTVESKQKARPARPFHLMSISGILNPNTSATPHGSSAGEAVEAQPEIQPAANPEAQLAAQAAKPKRKTASPIPATRRSKRLQSSAVETGEAGPDNGKITIRFPDHDVFEGLPIRQWRQVETVVGSAPEAEPVKGKDAWPEPPMPRDSHLLPEVSQQLLRAARAGRLYKPAEPANDDDKENADEEKETKETQKGFAARKWTQVPRHLEEPEREYLAKRRKGLPSAYANLSGLIGPLVQTGEMRKTKVKKTDAAGNVHIYEVLVEPGKTLENEVVETEPAAAQPAEVAVPGTVVEGVGIVNADGLVVASDIIQPTPPRRRPPPPRRKPKKGPGRGRKRVVFEPGTEGARGSLGSNQITSAGTQAATTAGESTSGVPSTGSDTPMADAGNEEGSGEDGDESDESEDDNDREEESSRTTRHPLPQGSLQVLQRRRPYNSLPQLGYRVH